MNKIKNNNKSQTFTNIEKDHWEKNWQSNVNKNPLSLLNIFNRDAINLLSGSLKQVSNPIVLEIGFVPGKYLQYFEKQFNAECHGYDYSETGCKQAREFFSAHGSTVSVHHQDVLTNPPKISHQAQLIYSIGVVEHFENPVGMINAHLTPLAEDGVAIIILPNYQGLNLWIQKRLDSKNLEIHNLNSMTSVFWEKYADEYPDFEFKTRTFGRMNPWMFSLWRLGMFGKLIQLSLNFGSFLLPKNVKFMASMFVIEIRRR
jgi:hypothetical protein